MSLARTIGQSLGALLSYLAPRAAMRRARDRIKLERAQRPQPALEQDNAAYLRRVRDRRNEPHERQDWL